MNKRISIIISLILLANFSLFGQVSQIKTFDPNYKIIFKNPTQDKNFYLLSLMQNQSDVRRALNKNKLLKELMKNRLNALKNSSNCVDVKCYDSAFRFTEIEIETIAKFFEQSAINKELTKLADNHLRPSGMFIRYDQKSNHEMLALAWRDAAKGVNHILDVFGLGKDALYKNIDNVSYDVNSAEYQQILKSKVAEIKLKKDALFFEPTLSFAMKLLEANRRDEAGRHEPYAQTVNQKAVEYLKNIKWDAYPYSVILVLGSGPKEGEGSLGKISMERADEAVKLYREKKAPLLIFSGGYVHPARTPHCEAIEIKKYVMQKHGIPEENILVEVQARHTTTNVRNAARIMFRDGIPTTKKGLITSSQSHIDYVAGEAFKKRFIDEIGFVPMQIVERISPIAVEFIPLKESLFVNSMETLDP